MEVYVRACAVFLGVLGVIAIGVPLASADPPNDFVTGGGISAIGTTFGFTAHSGPNGEDPSGHATFKNKAADTDRRGHVICLRVSGKRAVFGVKLDSADTPLYREFVIADNGNPVGGQPVDELRQSSASNTPPTCSTIPAGGLVLRRGNIQVHDAD